MENGVFVLSLDLELMWGAIFNEPVRLGFEHRTPYVSKIIPRLLSLFEQYNVHATWATVGAIACVNKEQAANKASKKISDPYWTKSLVEFIELIPDHQSHLYFAPELIKIISKTEGQEIATHTFSHFYFAEHDDAKTKLKDEIAASKEILELATGKLVTSLVMPKNQVKDDIRDAMSENGLFIYRGSQVSKRDKKGRLFRIARFIDAYLPFCGDSTYPLIEIADRGFYNVRASAFWRTYFSKLSILEPFKLIRIKQQMKYAAKNGRVFHLWFHPHNLSSEYNLNLKKLENLLKYYDSLRIKYGMESRNMEECARKLRLTWPQD